LSEYISVDFPEAVPHLRLVKNLRKCNIDLVGQGSIDSEILELAALTNLTELTISADTTSATWGELGRLKELTALSLSLREPPSELGFIGALTHLQNLDIFSKGTLSDFSFLNTLTELTSVSLRATITDDLTPISLVPSLRRLQVFGSEPVDLTPLANCDLEVWLSSGIEAHGVDQLGPGVRLTGQGSKGLMRG
jgi:Leucine-rich repeat (LRR) protein